MFNKGEGVTVVLATMAEEEEDEEEEEGRERVRSTPFRSKIRRGLTMYDDEGGEVGVEDGGGTLKRDRSQVRVTSDDVGKGVEGEGRAADFEDTRA